MHLYRPLRFTPRRTSVKLPTALMSTHRRFAGREVTADTLKSPVDCLTSRDLALLCHSPDSLPSASLVADGTTSLIILMSGLFYNLATLNVMYTHWISVMTHNCGIHTRVGTLIVATIYLQLIQNRYMFRSFTVLQCSYQHCVQPVASVVEVVRYL